MSYKFDSIVNKNEADALKDMIFRRARERAKSMNEDAQSDVMDMARESFVSNNNPFSKIIETPIQNNTPSINTQPEPVKEPEENVGFPIKPQNAGFDTQSKIIKEQITSAAIVNTMKEAREGLSNRKSFMGALNFLNTQAAISLSRTRADKFEILA